MKKTELKEEILKMRFEDTYLSWQSGRLTQEQAAEILGYSDRTFRRHCRGYEIYGIEALTDKRLHQISHRRAPVDEVIQLVNDYETAYLGWNVKHFHEYYQLNGGKRSYSWVKNMLQSKKSVPKTSLKGIHRKKRERKPLTGMMIHQDASTHEWISGVQWDLVVTMDDATNEHYSMFFVHQEGTMSSLQGVKDVIENKGLFCSFYSDRGSHYWTTPVAGGKVDKHNLTQFGEAMKALNIQMIAAYSPQARGRSERMFRTHQGRLPQELAKAGITDMDGANKYLRDIYLPNFNKRFSRIAAEKGTAFVCYQGNLDDVLCEKHTRVVGNDNCVKFEKLILQIPEDGSRYHYVRAKVSVLKHIDSSLSIFYGPRRIGHYSHDGVLLSEGIQTAV